MSRNLKIQHIRTTRANLDTQAAANNLNQGEIYLITDENRIAIGLTVSTYEVYSKLSEIPVKATGTEINTGTDDAKYVTAKAIADSNILFSSEITTIKKLTAAEYAALGTKDSTTMYVIVG